MTMPRIVEPSAPVESWSPVPPAPGGATTTFRTVLRAPWAFVFADDPGCVYPSIRTGLETTGSPVAGVMVQTPEPSQPAPVTLNAIVSRPALAFASRIACRSDPAPESPVFVTV